MRTLAIGCLWLIGSAARAQGNESWWPASGTVILGGGGQQEESATALVDRLIVLAGGPDARIVIIPSASDGLPERWTRQAEPKRIADLRAAFEERGARHVTFLHTRDRRRANSDELAVLVREARGVFISGGATKVLDQTFAGTLVARELRDLLVRGGVLAGDSAGAITLGCFWLSWPTPTSDLQKVTDGTCALPRVTVLPHARPQDAAAMEREILGYVRTHGSAAVVAIAENTWLELRGSRAVVHGPGNVRIFGTRATDPGSVVTLRAGTTTDLAKP